MTRWTAHGLVWSSDVDLDAQRAPHGAQPDVELRLGAAGPVLGLDEVPSGRLLAERVVEGRRLLSVVESTAGEGARDVHFHGLARARISAHADEVTLSMAPDADPGLAAVLLNGTLMSIVLTLRGHPVLHASAVTTTWDGVDSAIAFVGQSGMGKSTVATLACRDGARLLTDDVLCTDIADAGVLAHPGAVRTRLRDAARPLGEQLLTRDVVTTADGRASTGLPTAGPAPVELAALVVPVPDRDLHDFEVRRVRGIEGVILLSRFPRIVGWTDPLTSGQAHAHWGELARRVPVLVLRLPWGPPFPDGHGRAVTDLIRDTCRVG